MKKKSTILLLFALLWLSYGCIKEDLEFPNVEPRELPPSISLIALLDALENDKDEHLEVLRDFVDFVYPLSLQLNTGPRIEVKSLEALLDIARSQNKDFYALGVQFPFQVTISGDLKTIENESEFDVFIRACGVTSFNDQFFSDYLQCFDFSYPIQLTEENGTKTTIPSSEDLNRFVGIRTLGLGVDFAFPFVLTRLDSQNSPITINSYKGFYEQLRTCTPIVIDECPENINLIITPIGENVFRFDLGFEFAGGDDKLFWQINGVGNAQFVNGWEDNYNRSYEYLFDPGLYEVCMKLVTPECPDGVEYCHPIIEAIDLCPELSFNFENITGNTYNFFADFESKDEIEYTWIILFKENTLLEEDEGPDGDDELEYTFAEPGEYHVFIYSDNPPGCGKAVSYERTIVII